LKSSEGIRKAYISCHNLEPEKKNYQLKYALAIENPDISGRVHLNRPEISKQKRATSDLKIVCFRQNKC